MAHVINGVFDANEWEAATRLGTGPTGYAVYGAVDGDAFVFAFQGATAVGLSTTLWLNTDGNTATGYSIFGLNTGADFNVTFTAPAGGAATPYLYNGADAQNYLADIAEYAFSADRTTVEFRIPFSLLNLSGASAITDVYADINNNVFLPGDYSQGALKLLAPASRTPSPGRDLLTGTDGAELIDALAGDDTVNGGAGHDTLVGGAGNDSLDGGAGHDTAGMGNAGFRGASVSASGGGVALTSAAGTDTLANIEIAAFADGRLVFDAADPAAQVARLYEAALDRLPDQGGLNFWIDAVQHGQSLSGLAAGFLASGEFQARFGGASASNGAFVDQLYLNILGRAPEAEGRKFWVDSLDAGTGRAEVLVGISESAENKAGTAALVQRGIWDRSESAAEVARLYDTVFGRLPDAPGLVAWRDALDKGQASLAQVADAFAGSAEFQAKYGALGNRDFADALYVNTLDRPSDQAGLDHWTGVLDGGVGRAEVVLAFSESAEHVALTATSIGGESPAQHGILFA